MIPPSPDPATDRDLLFGLIALRVGLVPSSRLVDVWYPAANRIGAIRERVIERGGLTSADVAALDHLVGRRVEAAGGDAPSALDSVVAPDERPLLAAARQSTAGESLATMTVSPTTRPTGSGPTIGWSIPTPVPDSTGDSTPEPNPSETRSALPAEIVPDSPSETTDPRPVSDPTAFPHDATNSTHPSRTQASNPTPLIARDSQGRTREESDSPDRTGSHVSGESPNHTIMGERFGYEVLRLHAVGGMGQVWVARDPAIGREVALKDLRPQRAGHSSSRRRFAEEARITGQLEHPNIVPVYTLSDGGDGRSPFYTMKFLRGRTLSAAAGEYHTRRAAGTAGPLDLRTLLGAFIGVCNALAYAHSRGVIHRDLKGANVLLGEYGEVVVLDWGLAKTVAQPDAGSLPSVDPTIGVGRDETVHGSILGTPAFMPPEQAEGRLDEINERSDVYGLGAILYEILTGQPPFSGANASDILRKVLRDPPIAPQSIVPGTPRPLEAICLKALSKAPADRYSSARELTDDVQRYLADEPVTADREPVLERFGRRARRNRTLVAAVAVAAAVLIPGLVVFAEVERRNANQLGAKEKDARDARDLAETRLAQTIDTWHTQVIDVQNELDYQGISPLFRQKLVRTARDRLTDVLAGRPLDARTGHMLAAVHFDIISTTLTRGQTEVAAQEWENARRIVEEALRADPTGVDALRDMANLHLLQGDIQQRQKNPRAALEAYEKAGAGLEALPGEGQKDPRLRLDRFQLAERQAAVLAQLGQSGQARKVREEALARLRAQVQDNPEDVRAAQELLRALTATADAMRADSAIDAARMLLAEARDRADPLLRDDAQNRFLTDLLARIHFQTGEIETSRQRPQDARDAYQRCLKIRLEMAGGRSASLDRLQSLAVVYERLGDLSFQTNALTQAETEFGEAVRILEQWAVVEEAPEVLAAFATCLVRLGATQQARGDILTARATLTRGLDLRAKLASGEAPDPAAVFALAESHWMFGDLERSPAALDFVAAVHHFRKAEELLRKLERAGEFDQHPAWVQKFKQVRNIVEYCSLAKTIINDLALADKLPEEQAFPLLVARSRVWVRRGNVAEVVATADAILHRWPNQSYPLANGVARGYALAAGAAKAPADRDRYSAAATRFLEDASRAGYPVPTINALIAQDPDFVALRTIPPAVP